jgi:hypothetical protein
LATGTPSARLDRMVNQAEPVKLPPRPITELGAKATLWWQERRAGAEL